MFIPVELSIATRSAKPSIHEKLWWINRLELEGLTPLTDDLTDIVDDTSRAVEMIHRSLGAGIGFLALAAYHVYVKQEDPLGPADPPPLVWRIDISCHEGHTSAHHHHRLSPPASDNFARP